jgi:hypothetical protein
MPLPKAKQGMKIRTRKGIRFKLSGDKRGYPFFFFFIDIKIRVTTTKKKDKV